MQEHAKTLTRVVVVHRTLVNETVDVPTTLLLLGSVCVIFVTAVILDGWYVATNVIICNGFFVSEFARWVGGPFFPWLKFGRSHYWMAGMFETWFAQVTILPMANASAVVVQTTSVVIGFMNTL
nr:hypothetical protein [Tanacetum cinerariifolium]